MTAHRFTYYYLGAPTYQPIMAASVDNYFAVNFTVVADHPYYRGGLTASKATDVDVADMLTINFIAPIELTKPTKLIELFIVVFSAFSIER